MVVPLTLLEEDVIIALLVVTCHCWLVELSYGVMVVLGFVE